LKDCVELSASPVSAFFLFFESGDKESCVSFCGFNTCSGSFVRDVVRLSDMIAPVGRDWKTGQWVTDVLH
jgi:hypothetical protein